MLQKRGQDLHVFTKISFLESYTGTTRTFLVNVEDLCSVCHGTRQSSIRARTCLRCEGRRVVSLTRRATASLAAGVDDGQKVRVVGKGAPSLVGGKPGDLYVHIHVIPDPLYERKGADLHLSWDVQRSLVTAGGVTQVRMPDGTFIRVPIPKDIRDGTTVRVRNAGMPNPQKGKRRGDLYVRIHIVDQRAPSRVRVISPPVSRSPGQPSPRVQRALRRLSVDAPLTLDGRDTLPRKSRTPLPRAQERFDEVGNSPIPRRVRSPRAPFPSADDPPVLPRRAQSPPPRRRDHPLPAVRSRFQPPSFFDDPAPPAQAKPSAHDQRLQSQLGNYRLTRHLGSGGFADVYLAEHVLLGTQAAIKMLRGQVRHEEAEAFLREAKTIMGFKHAHIIRVLDVGLESRSGTPYLVMEYASGGTLRDRYPDGSQLPLEVIVAYLRQIADALDYAHQHKVIHRDVKPANVLIEAEHLLLSDFGIAVTAHTTSSLSTQNAFGTVTYMAPEQLRKKPRPASDQYALAVLAYEWIAGEPPFQGSATEIVAAHLSDEPPSLLLKRPALSRGAEAVILRGLAKDPEQRYSGVRVFVEALVQHL